MPLTDDDRRRVRAAMRGRDAGDRLISKMIDRDYATAYFVDTVNGDDDNDGKTWQYPFATMAQALSVVADNGKIYVVGDVREQCVAPLGVQGVAIIGAAGGRTRHDDGVRWREPASPTAATPLLKLREQGWEVHNILFVPPADDAAIEIKRREDATDPDGSHCIISGCKFVGAGQSGIEDNGGAHHVLVENCEFFTLTNGIKSTSTTIANPLRWIIRDSRFQGCTNAITMPFSDSEVRGCTFDAGTKVIDLETGGGSGNNWVVMNFFDENEADIDNAHGYFGVSTDVWRNYSKNTAAMSVGYATA